MPCSQQRLFPLALMPGQRQEITSVFAKRFAEQDGAEARDIMADYRRRKEAANALKMQEPEPVVPVEEPEEEVVTLADLVIIVQHVKYLYARRRGSAGL